MRRQPAPDVPASGPAHILFDGRLLDVSTEATGRNYNKIEEHFLLPSKTFKPQVARTLVRPIGDKPPLTPPRVSGVSCAPVPDSEMFEIAKLQQKGTTFLNQRSHGIVNKPDAAGKIISGQTNNVGNNGHNGTEVRQGGYESIIAEGKSFQKTNSSFPYLDPRIAIYNEINEADSLCGTPAPFRFNEMSESLDSSGPLGPISAAPLSPSLLTLCEDFVLTSSPQQLHRSVDLSNTIDDVDATMPSWSDMASDLIINSSNSDISLRVNGAIEDTKSRPTETSA